MYTEVAFLSEFEIEGNAEDLLNSYGRAYATITCPPVPVEHITEKHVGLTLDFTDLNAQFGGDDVMGALWANDRAVFVDEQLDYDVYPAMEGRCRFTVGHELGHWCQHRYYFEQDPAQTSLFEEPSLPSVVCRTGGEQSRIEYQANRFSAALLMPKPLVFAAWRETFGNTNPLGWDTPEAELDLLAGRFAQKFGVSRQAMRIRLLQLGLVQTEPQMGSWSSWASN